MLCCCARLEALGISLDPGANEGRIGPDVTAIGRADGQVAVLVVRTDEELEIAEQAYDLVTG